MGFIFLTEWREITGHVPVLKRYYPALEVKETKKQTTEEDDDE